MKQRSLSNQVSTLTSFPLSLLLFLLLISFPFIPSFLSFLLIPLGTQKYSVAQQLERTFSLSLYLSIYLSFLYIFLFLLIPLGTQKYSVAQQLERTFSKYITFSHENNELLMQLLQRLIRESQTMGEPDERIIIDVEEFDARVRK